MKDENVLIDLTQLFKGYNLKYSLNGTYQNNYSITEPVMLKNQTKLPFNVTEGKHNNLR